MQNTHVEFQPWSARRLEDRRLVTGTGRYVGDIAPANSVYAAFVRSPIAHGEITELDVEDARQSPGVLAVFMAGDLNLKAISSEIPPVSVQGMSRPPLASDRVRFVGETVAVVIAETAEQAVDAAGLAWIDVEPLPVVVDPKDALEDASVLHAEAGTNLVARSSLGSNPSNWDFAVDVTVDVRNQRLSPVPIEPLAALAVPDQTGGLRLFVGHQMPHKLKRQLIQQLDNEAIEVIVPDVGGGFGMKARLFPEYIVISAAALRLGRPVRWLQTRRENLLTGSHGRDMLHRVRLGGDSSGRIRRAHIDILNGVGAYPHTGGQVTTFTRLLSQEMYDIEEFTMETTTVVNNLAPIAPYRGAGRPEAAYAMERAIDVFARRAELDPVEVRRRNLIPPSRLPYRAATGALYDSGDYPAALERTVDLIDLESVREEQASRRERGENPIGIGFGAYVERAGGPVDSGEYGRVELAEDGIVVVRTGSTSNGQGHETVFTQVAAEVFDVPLDRVRFIAGDTSQVADGWGSTASRSAQIGASGIWRNALRVREKAAELAAEMMETDPDHLILTEGMFVVAGAPDRSITLNDVARYSIDRGVELAAEEFYSPGAQTFPYGVYAAVVEVDLETGEVHPIRVAAVDDCGNVLNPMIVDGQTIGSLVQGLGQALIEGIVYDSEGQLLTATLMDYALPRALDVPETILDRIVSPAPSNPLGVKGAGEAGCIGGPPAFVNAVLDALAPYGVTDLDMPLRAPTIWEALRKARESTSA
jgi:carbon-monoxide dehydrogenase large subunit